MSDLPQITTTLPPRKRAKTQEEKEQRRIERILRNRRAAHASREKKRKHVEFLECSVEKLQSNIQAYKCQKSQLFDLASALLSKLKAINNDYDLSDLNLSALELPEIKDVVLDQPIFDSKIKSSKSSSTSLDGSVGSNASMINGSSDPLKKVSGNDLDDDDDEDDDLNEDNISASSLPTPITPLSSTVMSKKHPSAYLEPAGLSESPKQQSQPIRSVSPSTIKPSKIEKPSKTTTASPVQSKKNGLVAAKKLRSKSVASIMSPFSSNIVSKTSLSSDNHIMNHNLVSFSSFLDDAQNANTTNSNSTVSSSVSSINGDVFSRRGTLHNILSLTGNNDDEVLSIVGTDELDDFDNTIIMKDENVNNSSSMNVDDYLSSLASPIFFPIMNEKNSKGSNGKKSNRSTKANANSKDDNKGQSKGIAGTSSLKKSNKRNNSLNITSPHVHQQNSSNLAVDEDEFQFNHILSNPDEYLIYNNNSSVDNQDNAIIDDEDEEMQLTEAGSADIDVASEFELVGGVVVMGNKSKSQNSSGKPSTNLMMKKSISATIGNSNEATSGVFYDFAF